MNAGVAPRCSRVFASCSRWLRRSARRRSICVRTVDQQPLVVPRLLDVVARAAAHRLDRAGDAAPRRHDEDRQRRIERPDALHQVEAFLADVVSRV